MSQHTSQNQDPKDSQGLMKSQEQVPSLKSKQKSKRTKFTPQQLEIFRDSYKEDPYPNADKINKLARETEVDEKTIRIWMQNRRREDKQSSSKYKGDVRKKSATLSYVDCTSQHPPSLVKQAYMKDFCFCKYLQKCLSEGKTNPQVNQTA